MIAIAARMLMLTCLVAAGASIPARAPARQAGPAKVRVGPPTDIKAGHTRVMHSLALGERRVFHVHLPRGYEQSTARHPVLYVLDGDLNHGWIGETARYLRMSGDLPGLIVVGVANVDRDRDFTPFAVDDVPVSGGADAFMRFLVEELLPFVDLEYRTEPYRILYGHSLGGLFAVHALFARPDAFHAAIAPSPALYYDRGLTLRRIEETARGGIVMNRFLYTGQAGELTYPEAMRFLRETLETHEPAGLRWRAVDLPELDHGSIPLRILPDALRLLYEGWKLPADVLSSGFDAVLAHYAALGERFGYPVRPSEGLVNRLGYLALQDGEIDRARDIFERNTELYPDAFNTWDSLAEAWMRLGDREKAVRFYRRSLELNPDHENARLMLEQLARGDTTPPGSR